MGVNFQVWHVIYKNLCYNYPSYSQDILNVALFHLQVPVLNRFTIIYYTHLRTHTNTHYTHTHTQHTLHYTHTTHYTHTHTHTTYYTTHLTRISTNK